MMQCGNKKAYPTKYKADRALGIIWKVSISTQSTRTRPCRSYQCSECHKWHLTSRYDVDLKVTQESPTKR